MFVSRFSGGVAIFKNCSLVYISILLILGQASAITAETRGGWDISGEGQTSDSGISQTVCSASDPSITLGIASNSYVFGPGTSSNVWDGSQNLVINLAGFRLQAGYDGKVDSSVILTSQGSASSAAFVGASASGIATGKVPAAIGGDSYDIFGWADITSEGFMNGKGTASSLATGSANFDVQKPGTSSEAWGSVTGSSNMALESGSINGIISTSGGKNGLHAESRVTRNLRGDIFASTQGELTSYASIVNKGNANVTTIGEAKGGSWDPTFVGTKVKTTAASGNENVAFSAKGNLGTLDQRVETKADNDAASVSSILQSSASKTLSASGNLVLSAFGGPATYAAASQESSSTQTFAQTWVRDALWGSIAKSKDNQMALEWGQVANVGSGAICHDPSSALSFAKIDMTTDYTSTNGLLSYATGNMTISTFAQATQNTTALGGAIINGAGKGDILASDSKMTNAAGYSGGMDHISFVDAGRISSSGARGFAMTRNIADYIYASTNPIGSPGAVKPFQTNSAVDPIFAWSSSEAFYTQSH